MRNVSAENLRKTDYNSTIVVNFYGYSNSGIIVTIASKFELVNHRSPKPSFHLPLWKSLPSIEELPTCEWPGLFYF